jgi:hypothetical protein
MTNKCIKINLCILVLSVYNISFSQSLIGNKLLVKFDFNRVKTVINNFKQDKVLGTGRRRKIAIDLSMNNQYLQSFSKVCFNTCNINYQTSVLNRFVFCEKK